MAKRRTRRRIRPRGIRVTAVSNYAQLQSLVSVVNEHNDAIAGIRRELDVQFRRLAQMQAELDVVKHAWHRMKGRA